MNLKSWGKVVSSNREVAFLLALIMTFAGLALIIDRPKGAILEWFALPLLVAGGAVFAFAVWPRGEIAASKSDSMASRLLRWVTLGNRLVPLFPALGVGIVLADIVYNWFLSATPAIQTEDTIVLLTAVTLLAYRFVPGRFARERDFVLIFFLCLNLILVVPLLLMRAFYADFERSVDAYSWIALAPEAGGVLQLIGVSNSVHPVPGSTAPGLTFTPLHFSTEVTVVITTACSGIYSFGIFASAFVAFVLTEYSSLSRRIWLLLGLGLVTAYAANVLRMVVIVLVGYYTDSVQTDLQNMLVAHSYAGWIIFLGWIALFWSLLLRLMAPSTARLTSPPPGHNLRKSTRGCSICGAALTPLAPAIRCACGATHHRRCLESTSACPLCSRRLSSPLAAESPVQ